MRNDPISALEAAAVRGHSRRGFMARAAAAGLTVNAASALWTKARAQEPATGGALRFGADGGGASDSMNPLTALGVDHTTCASFSCYDTLTEMDAEGNPQPSLAESWEGNADGVWAIKLRKDVEFHDGKTLTPEDVVWSLAQHQSDASKNGDARQIVGNIEEIRADGRDTVILKQRELNFDLPSHLSSFGLLIGKEGAEDWDAGVGTGPYALESWEPGVSFVGRKFENFYRDDQGYFDSVEILNVVDVAARAAGLMSQTLDAIGSPDVQTAGRLARAPGYELLQVSGTQHFTTDMRTDSGPMIDPHVRNAVKWGVKRQEIVDKILGGYGTIGNDIPLARNQKFYNDQLEQREFDPERARWHLEQAGVDDLALTFHTSDGAFAGAVDMGVLMQQSLAECGIAMDVAREPADGYWSNVWSKEPWTASYYAGRPTADWMMTSQYSSASQWDATYFKNEAFDALLTQARAEQDEAKRQELYFEAQKMLWEEGGALVVAFVNILIAASEKLGHGPIGVGRRLDNARIARRWWFKA